MMICLSLTFQSIITHAAEADTKVAVSKSIETKKLLNRLNEINLLDKSNLKTSEKKQLREEVLAIKSNFGPGGVYISVGGLIIIILLLIILL